MKEKGNYSIKFIYTYLRPYTGACLLVFFCLVFEVAIVSGFQFSFKYIIDDALIKQNTKLLALILIILAVAGTAEVFVGIYEDYLFTSIIANVLRDIRNVLFNHLQRLSISFIQQKKQGDFLSHFSADLISIENMLSTLNSRLVTPILFLLIELCLMAILSWQLLIFMILAGLVILIGPRIMLPRIASASLIRKNMDADLLSFANENIQLQSVIRAYGLFHHMLVLFNKINHLLTNQIRKLYFLELLSIRTAELSSLLVKIILLCVGSAMAYKHFLSVGSLIAFFLIFSSALMFVTALANYVAIFTQNTGGVRRIQNFLNEPARVFSNTFNPGEFNKEITFENVNFSYSAKNSVNPDPDINTGIHGLSLRIAKNSSVAFVGSSGSGKSTIINLLLRFYDPVSGHIKIDGVDLKNISPDFLQHIVGYVTQEPLLFNMTVRQNIAMGKLDARTEEIERAAIIAEIHETILGLPEGYETVLTEHGGNLSVGQRQRLTIARAIVRNPAILIFDEPTSALDSVTENAINQTLLQIMINCTCILVSHRLNMMVNFAHIFVIQQGRICEQGTHEYLLSLNGVYATMWANQSGFTIIQDSNEVKITPQRLQLIPLFKDISLDFLSTLAEQFETENFAKDEEIITEGELGDTFYIIVRGRVEVLKNSESGKQKRIAILEDGDYFGEIALIKSITRTASVRALIPTMCITLRRTEFMNLLSLHPELRAMIEYTVKVRQGFMSNL